MKVDVDDDLEDFGTGSAAGAFDAESVAFDESPYEEDATSTDIAQVMRDVRDLQAAIFCAIDMLIEDSYHEVDTSASSIAEAPTKPHYCEPLLSVAVNVPAFRRLLGCMVSALVKQTNEERISCSNSTRAFFTYQCLLLVDKATRASQEFIFDALENNFEHFRYALFNDDWMESKLLVNMDLIFNKLSFDLSQDIEFRLTCVAPQMNAEIGGSYDRKFFPK